MPRHKQTVPNRRHDEEQNFAGAGSSTTQPFLFFNSAGKQTGSDGDDSECVIVETSSGRSDNHYKAISARLSTYDFYLTIDSSIAPSAGSSSQSAVESTHLTTDVRVHVRLTAPRPEQLPSAATFWLYMRRNSAECVVYYEWSGEAEVSSRKRKRRVVKAEAFEATVGAGEHLCEAIANVNPSVVRMIVDSYCCGELILQLIVSTKTVVKLEHASDMARRSDAKLRHLMRLILPPLSADVEFQHRAVSSDDVQPLFDYISQYHSSKQRTLSRLAYDGENEGEHICQRSCDLGICECNGSGRGGIELPDPQHPLLRPTLRNYQKRAVRWMLRQERWRPEREAGDSCGEQRCDRLHQLFVEVEVGGERLYYNRYGGWFVRERPTAVSSPPGGILADEMGLGKTVEILSLILCHQRLGVAPVRSRENRLVESGNSIGTEVAGDGIQKDSFSDHEMLPKNPVRNRSRLISSGISDEESERDVRDSCDLIAIESGADRSSSDTTSHSIDEYRKCSLTRAERLDRRKNQKCNYRVESDTEGDFDTNLTDVESAFDITVEKAGESLSAETLIECDRKSAGNNACSHDQHKVINSRIRKRPLSKQQKLLGLRRAAPEFDHTCSYSTSIDDAVVRVCYGGHPPKFYRRGVGVVHPARKRVGRRGHSASIYRRLAQTHYEHALADSSTVYRAVQRRQQLQRRRQLELCRFSCLCGRWNDQDDGDSDRSDSGVRKSRRRKMKRSLNTLVECETCGLRQHAVCVGYNLQDSQRGAYHCPQCWSKRSPITSAATLIVSPSAISQQWVDEIEKHIAVSSGDESVDGGKSLPALKVHVYNGVRSDRYMQPQALANCDIVVTTYNVLQRELNYVQVGRTTSSLAGDAVGPENGSLGDVEGRRRVQRYLAPPTPLLCVDWWRVCLDEAQMVECTTTRTAEMALRLTCVNRWCVTGTPISRSLADLYGLLLFVGLDPFVHEHWWNQLVYYPYLNGVVEPARRVLRQCFWRSAKTDVAGEIADIPAQTECYVWLDFSPLESYFYRWQQAKQAGEARRAIDRHSDSNLRLCDMEVASVQQLMAPLLRLRQACCQPQIHGAGGAGQQLTAVRTAAPLTMGQLLEQMVRRATVDAEEAHRQRTAALCGLAALHIEERQLPDAVELYRSVLRNADQLCGQLKTDLLQRLHAAHNLHEMLSSSCQGVNISPTLRDSELPVLVAQLRAEYASKYDALVEESVRDLGELTDEVDQQPGDDADGEPDDDWFGHVILAHCNRHASAGWSLTEKVTEELVQLSSGGDRNVEKQADLGTTKRTKTLKTRLPVDSMIDKFSSPADLHMLLASRVDAVERRRQSVLTAVKQLMRRDPASLVSAAVDCHLRTAEDEDHAKSSAAAADNDVDDDIAVGEEIEDFLSNSIDQGVSKKRLCAVCSTERPLIDYERRLFYIQPGRVDSRQLDGVDGTVQLHGQLARGSWRDSETGHVLRQLLAWGRQLGGAVVGGERVLKQGTRHLRRLDVMKREFRQLRVLWRRVSDRVSAHDELLMATTRLRLRAPLELLPASSTNIGRAGGDGRRLPINVLEPSQLPSHRLQLQAELAAAEAELRKRLGQRLYLINLQRSGDSGATTAAAADTNCPICERPLGVSWSVLRCGHSFCIGCTHTLMENYSSVVGRRQRIRCAVCRDWCAHTDVGYVCADNCDDGRADGDKTSPNESANASPCITVRGSYSTKVEAVVRCTLRVLATECSAKLLVFCSWTEPLDVVASALAENGVEARRLHAPGRFDRHLQEFRQVPGVVRVLLLPVQLGARGLNLVEATHVLLMNPLLDSAAERQAVGRVHRLGQTKATVVHRLLVRDTVEERIQSLFSDKHRRKQSSARRKCPHENADNGDSDSETKTASLTASTRENEELSLAELRQLFADD